MESRFLDLQADARLLLYTLWTAPEASLCGIVAITDGALAERMKVPAKRIATRRVELENAEFLKSDPDARLIWLFGYIETQLGAMPGTNPKWRAATIKELSALPQTAMIAQFRMHYGLAEPAADRVSDRPSDRVSTPYSGTENSLSIPYSEFENRVSIAPSLPVLSDPLLPPDADDEILTAANPTGGAR